MFIQHEAYSGDISESRLTDSLMSTVDKLAVIEYAAANMSEAALVSMAKLGDSDAFVELSKLHANRSCGRSIKSPGIGTMLKTRSRMQR